MQYHDSVYFIIVTLSTVGYGDISPQSTPGKIFVLGIVIITIVIIPRQTSQLLNLMNMQSKYRRTTYKAVEVSILIYNIMCIGETSSCNWVYRSISTEEFL